MNLRTEWIDTNSESVEETYFNRNETIESVKSNFDIRRQYSCEGKQLTIGEQTDWCIVQTSSNPLKQFNEQLKISLPLTMNIKKGSYVTYENHIWMVDTNIIDVDGAYYSAKMTKCNWKLKWQNEDGEIIERWIVTKDASSYSDGTEGNNMMVIGADQLMILLPYDDETVKLDRGKRFFISHKSSPLPYKITRPDTTTHMDIDLDNNKTGYLSIIVTESQKCDNDRVDLMLCDYIEVTDDIVTSTDGQWYMKLLSVLDTIKPNGKSMTFNAQMYNGNNEPIDSDITYDWEINSTVDSKYISYSNNGKQLTLSLSKECEDYGKVIKVRAISKYTGQVKEIEITIVPVY